jgi:hypothetical protein
MNAYHPRRYPNLRDPLASEGSTRTLHKRRVIKLARTLMREGG